MSRTPMQPPRFAFDRHGTAALDDRLPVRMLDRLGLLKAPHNQCRRGLRPEGTEVTDSHRPRRSEGPAWFSTRWISSGASRSRSGRSPLAHRDIPGFDQPSSVPTAGDRVIGMCDFSIHAVPDRSAQTPDVAVSERRLLECGDSVRGAQLSTCRGGAFRCRWAPTTCGPRCTADTRRSNGRWGVA